MVRKPGDFQESVALVRQNKRYSRKGDLVKWQYSGTEGGLVRGIGVVNLVHSTGKDSDFFPVDHRSWQSPLPLHSYQFDQPAPQR